MIKLLILTLKISKNWENVMAGNKNSGFDKTYQQEKSLSEYSNRIHKALDYINENLGGDLNLKSVAGAAFFSQYHFHRIFTGIIGETPDDYIRRLRLEKAANLLLRNKAMSVTDIAFQCGFSTSSLFSRNFKKHFKTSPTQWKNSKNRQDESKKRKDILYRTDYNNYYDSPEKGTVNAEIRKTGEIPVIYMRSFSGYNAGIKLAYFKLFAWAKPRGLINENTKIIGIFLDNPVVTPREKCRLYACISVEQRMETPGDIGSMVIPGGIFAVFRFKGHKNELNDFYTGIYRCWFPASGYEPTDFPEYKVFIEFPDRNKRKEFVFDIHIMVQPI